MLRLNNRSSLVFSQHLGAKHGPLPSPARSEAVPRFRSLAPFSAREYFIIGRKETGLGPNQEKPCRVVLYNDGTV